MEAAGREDRRLWGAPGNAGSEESQQLPVVSRPLLDCLLHLPLLWRSAEAQVSPLVK